MTISVKNNIDGGRNRNTIAEVDPIVRTRFTSDSTSVSKLIQSLYTLTVYDLRGGGSTYFSQKPLAPTAASSVGDQYTAEFMFRMPPKTHEVYEPFATTIQVTQEGGKFVESQGSILKEIKIGGTTGLRPHKNASPFIDLLSPQAGELFGLLSNIQGAPSVIVDSGRDAGVLSATTTVSAITGNGIGLNEVIGHDDIIFLRNLFRLYSDLKESDEDARHIIMLWRNIKDGDYWVVEPLEFRLTQSSESPLTYNYSISLRTIVPFDYTFSLVLDPITIVKDSLKTHQRVRDYTNRLVNSLHDILKGKAKFLNLPIDPSEFLFEPITAVVESLVGYGDLANQREAILKSRFEKFKTGFRASIDVLDKRNQDPTESVRGLKRAYVTLSSIMLESFAQENIQKDVIDSRKQILDAYSQSDNLTLAKTSTSSGDPSFLGNQPIPTSIAQDVVGTTEDIRDIAQRVLGSRSQWHSLVIINKLDPPYISPEGGVNVLKPGDPILYPKNSPAISSPITSTTETLLEVEEQDEQVQGPIQQNLYGRDLRVFSTSSGVSNIKVDLRPNNRGDISSIQGAPNVSQALKLKFAIERGELPLHPSFGAQFKLGTKATPATLASFRLQVLSTLYSDVRVEHVTSLKFTVLADVILLSSSIVLRDSNQAISTKFPVRVF